MFIWTYLISYLYFISSLQRTFQFSEITRNWDQLTAVQPYMQFHQFNGCKTRNALHSKQRSESHVPYKFAPLKARFKGRYIQISYLYKGNKAYLPLWSCKRDGWINHCIWWYCSSFIVVIWKKLFYKKYFWLRFIWYLYVVG
jgi:hypothetical protein